MKELYKEFIQTMLERNFNNFRSEMDYVINQYIAGEIELNELDRVYHGVEYSFTTKIKKKNQMSYSYKEVFRKEVKYLKKLLRSEKLKVKSANEEISHLNEVIEKLKTESVHFSMDEIS
jgi:predicted  nucleic acid-binding Zn-ribbon protein